MHLYTLQHIIARFKFPFVVQLLIIANDIAYMRKRKNANAAAMYTAIEQALEAAYTHYKLN